jgi:hypothetical protein
LVLPADSTLTREILPLTDSGFASRLVPFIGWPAVSVVAMMLAAALYDPLSQISALTLGRVTLLPIDIGLACVGTVVILEALVRTHWKPVPRPLWPMATLILLLAMPIFVGLYKGYGVQSVMYQGRVAVYYTMFFAYWQLIPHKRIATNLLSVIVAIAAIGATYGLVAHAMGWQWQNGMSNVPTSSGSLSRGYGWWSAMPWYVWGAVIAFAYAWLSSASSGRRLVAGCVAGALVVSSLSTFIRSDFVGMVLGFVVVVLFGLRDASTWRRAVNRLWVSLPVLALVVVLLGGLAFTINRSYTSAVTERVRSIVGATQTSSHTAEVTREIRINAMADGMRSALRYPLGIGYGYLPGREVDVSVVKYESGHNGIAWLGFYMGSVGAVIVLFCFARLGFKLRRLVLTEDEYRWAAISVVAIFAAMIGQSLGAAYYFDSPHVYVLVPLLLAMAWTFGGENQGRVPSNADER